MLIFVAMTSYHFETRELAVSDTGVHLLRNRFNYQTIDFSEIKRLSIDHGKELNNWMAIFAIGLILVLFSLWYTFRLVSILNDNQVDVISIEEILVPLLPFMIGGYCLYSSTRRGTILRIETIDNKIKKYPLKEIEKENKLASLEEFLKAKLRTRVMA